MAGTGVTTSDECATVFNEFKLGNSLRYLVFKLSDNLEEVVVEHQGARDATYESFLEHFPENDCRYAVYNVEYHTDEDGDRSKIAFYLWAPDTAKTKSKMLYAGTKDTLKKALQGLQVEIQGTDLSEVDLETVIAKCRSISK